MAKKKSKKSGNYPGPLGTQWSRGEKKTKKKEAGNLSDDLKKLDKKYPTKKKKK